MILKLETPITEEDNFETIHDRLAELGVKGLLEVIPALENGTAIFEEQDDALSTYAAKISKEDGILDFSRPARELSCLIRGLSPFPLAYCKNGETVLKITDARSSADRPQNAECGEVISTKGGEITVACGEGSLRILGVFPESKKRMRAADYVNGGKIHVGDVLR
jgi:methionyl-tRNA formyltransferase